jgi:hypothetical protein
MRFLILPALVAALALPGCAALTAATDTTKTQAERIAAALEAGAQAFCAASLAVRDDAARKLTTAEFLAQLDARCLESDAPVTVKEPAR